MIKFDLNLAKQENIEYLETLFNEIVIENPANLYAYLDAINENIKNLFLYEVDMDIKKITYDEIALLIREYYDDIIEDINKCDENTSIEFLSYLSNKVKTNIEHPDFIFNLYKFIIKSNDIAMSDDLLEQQKRIIQASYLLKIEND
jgi:hypothetical protein